MSAAIETLRRWRDDPAAFVREALGAEPDSWQAEVLSAAARVPRIALKACKGPGKSCLLAWLILWFILTRPHAKIIATSISGPNLRDNLWAELALWYGKSPILQKEFDLNTERVTHRRSPKTWWCSARSWQADADKAQQANTLAGLHGEHVMAVMDEVGDYPDGVVVAAEGIFANDVEAKLLIAGNPTRTEGPLYRVCTNDRANWWVKEITGDPDDPKRAPRISVEWARKQIETWGRDNAWVLVNVFGKFPPTQSNKLLGPDEVMGAMKREIGVREYHDEARILGIDVARFGDDRTVFAPRQGRALMLLKVFRDLDTMEVAGQAALSIEKWKPHAVFVDQTGIGAGVVDRLRQMGHSIIGVDSASKPLDARFADKRAEMWWLTSQWVKAGAAIPEMPELVSELTGPTYGFDERSKIRVESKRDMKKRGLVSPDLADAIALTFAAPVAMPGPYDALRPGLAHGGGRVLTEWNPLAEEMA